MPPPPLGRRQKYSKLKISHTAVIALRLAKQRRLDLRGLLRDRREGEGESGRGKRQMKGEGK